MMRQGLDQDMIGSGPRRAPSAREQREAWEAFHMLRARAGQAAFMGPGDAAPTAAPGHGALPVVVLQPEAPLTADGDLRRAALVRFHQAGPHAFFQAADWLPVRDGANGPPLGLRLERVQPAGAWLTAAGLQPGDVLVRVNGHSLLLPDGFVAAWDGLPTTPHLQADVQRGATRLQMRWVVTPPADAATPPAAP
jgi:hypothetical protein